MLCSGTHSCILQSEKIHVDVLKHGRSVFIKHSKEKLSRVEGQILALDQSSIGHILLPSFVAFD